MNTTLLNYRSLARLILYCEPFILLAAGFFYWYPSNFPAASAATGIDGTEWRWLIGLSLVLLAVITSYRLSTQADDLSGPMRVGAGLGLLLIALIILAVIWPDAQNPLNVDRADWGWLLIVLVPVMIARFALYRRLWTFTPLDVFMIGLVVVCVLSVYAAPYPSRGLRMLIRPLYGMALVIFLVEWARRAGSLRGPLIVTAALGVLVGAVGLGATQWTVKSVDFSAVFDALPRWEPFFVAGGINPNEIAGAMTVLIPITGVIVVYPMPRAWRVLAALAFLLMGSALFLGQSRFAIAGVAGALGLIALIALPVRWRRVALAGVTGFVLIQVVVLFNLIPTGNNDSIGLSTRDLGTSSQRLDIWDSAIRITADYPLTGVGMNRFRYWEVARDYPIVGWDIPDPENPDSFRQRRPPHAHNSFFQIVTDLGVPGLGAFAGLHLAAAYMTWVTWSAGDRRTSLLAVGLFGGLLAHAAYGIGDTIPIWDRFAFLFWWVLGLIAALYILSREQTS